MSMRSPSYFGSNHHPLPAGSVGAAWASATGIGNRMPPTVTEGPPAREPD